MLFAAVTLKNWYTHKEYVNYYSDDFTKKDLGVFYHLGRWIVVKHRV